MSDNPQPSEIVVPTQASSSGVGWLWYFVLPVVVALVTFFVAMHKLEDPRDGALNALNGPIAAVLAAGAFVGTLVAALTTRLGVRIGVRVVRGPRKR
jgi:hypothetical protein